MQRQSSWGADIGITRIRNPGTSPHGGLPAEPPPSTTRIRETILLDERILVLRDPLVEAGFEVSVMPTGSRGIVRFHRHGVAPHPPILITATVRDWLTKNANPLTLGTSLVNVAEILGHQDGCATVLLRALADEVPTYGIFWMEFSPDGRRHLFLFARE